MKSGARLVCVNKLFVPTVCEEIATMQTDETTQATTTSASLPERVPPPEIVRIRVDLNGDDYRTLRHIAVDTSLSTNEVVCEAVRLLLRHYAAQGAADASSDG